MVHRSESELHLDSLLFEERNKEYGAYEIRSHYNSYVRIATFIGVAIFSLLVVTPKIVEWLTPEKAAEEEFVVKEVVLEEIKSIDETKVVPPPPPPNFEPPAPAPPVATTEFLPPKVMEDKEVVIEKEPPTQNQLHESNPGTETHEGEKENLNALIVDPNGSGTGNKEVEDPNAIALFVGEPSTFVGDYKKFLRKNLVYPSRARDNQIQGKVFLKFVVEKDGSVNDIKVVKGLNPDCDKEAIRVVKLTDKKWTPGKNNGQVVRSYKSLDIEFRLEY